MRLCRLTAAMIGTAVLVSVTSRAHAGLFDLSVSREREIGQRIMRQIKAKIPVYQDWEITAIGLGLRDAADRPELVQDFWVWPDPEKNAFALPGGYVFITEGLLEALDTQDEITFVLGHELAHVTCRHIAEEYAHMQKTSFFGDLLLMVLGAGNFVWQLADFARIVDSNQYSQKKEREADVAGYEMTGKAGFDPEAALAALESLRDKDEKEDPKWLNKLFGTHPLLSEREKRLGARQSEYWTRRPEIRPPLDEGLTPKVLAEIVTPSGKRWKDPVGASIVARVNRELSESAKMTVLRQWMLRRPESVPDFRLTLVAVPEKRGSPSQEERDLKTRFRLSAKIVEVKTGREVWVKESDEWRCYYEEWGSKAINRVADRLGQAAREILDQTLPPG